MSKKIIYIIISWVVIILSMTIYNLFPLIIGKEVLLEINPIDPRDLLRGDYVILNYKISSSELCKQKYSDDKVIVILKTDENNIADIESIITNREKVKSDLKNRLYLKGTIKNYRIKYGIENYFVKEKTGKEIENKINSKKKSYAKVMISPFGSAKVKELIL